MQHDPFQKWQDPAEAARAAAAESAHTLAVQTARAQPIWRRDRRVLALAGGAVLVLAVLVGTSLSGGTSSAPDGVPTPTDASPLVPASAATPADTGHVTFDQP